MRIISILVLLSAVVASVYGQTVVAVEAEGATTGAVGSGAATAAGGTAAGDVVVALTDSTSLVEAMAVATAQATTPKPKPTPTPTKTVPTPTHTPITVAGATASATATASSYSSRKSLLPSYSSIKADIDSRMAAARARIAQRREEIMGKFYLQDPTCYSLKDDMCSAIDDFHYCGFCVTEKFPYVKGYGLEYDEALIEVAGTKGKKEYQKVITPKGDCHGEFVYAGEYCPTCEKVLQCLIVCSGVDINKAQKAGVLEIKESCFKECGVTEYDLVTCGYATPHKPPTKKTPVVVHPPAKTPVVVVEPPKKAPTAVASATATATATASSTTPVPIVVKPSLATANAISSARAGSK
eukprot:TRINITY_DN8214_c0_g1_i2.p1 TRINITY_DN8214_c0_g1~~TRINITY_DN8214_c0_g1_i2.p1  ORF type:complete len:354 (-),score=83.26 TRINITY_DN8214_c0_g1_i2:190-1251(-)